MSAVMATIMVLAELGGALIFLKTKDTFRRIFLSCLGLGFAYAIVFSDIIPDATEHYSEISPVFWVCILSGMFCAYGIEKYGKYAGKYTAFLGFSFHNFCEGVVLTTATLLSPILMLGLILHKLPEGMVSVSFLEGMKDKTKVLAVFLSALLIPIGALLPIPENVAQPITAFAAGVILSIVSISMKIIISESVEFSRIKISTAMVIGAIIGGASCLIV
ncbi:zinc/iron permease [Lucifera butyrica]|uniref:Zinc/iron permease n=1 Tax=Lucifera butyrica TaxID=1351585 RepID=A0A498RFG5_9FIRM|nr:hypothetical protein [Lucifera butyrica]VBB09550.1 zinc/iron permease [Lucifera butyrica]